MTTTTLKNASARYTEESLLTFLEGKQGEKWALGILRASTPEDIEQALKNLSSSYGNTPRFEFLKKVCGVF